MPQFTPEELTQFTDSAARYLATASETRSKGSDACDARRFSNEQWARYAELGWLALVVPEEYGGLGAGAFELSKLLECAGRHLVPEPFFPTLAVSAPLIAAVGTEQRKAELLPRIASGQLVVAFAHAERFSGHERDHLNTIATKSDGGTYAISGEKQGVLLAEAAGQLLVSTRSVDGRSEVFIVDAQSEGLKFSTYKLVDGRSAADISFDDVQAEALHHGDAAPAIEQVLNLATALLCAETMGIVTALREATVDYSKNRAQFGRTIGSFQVLQHRMVDMLTGEQEAWAITRCALKAVDAGLSDAPKLVSAAKARVDQVARFVGEQAIQIHGGIGMSDELIVGSWFKRLILNASLFGDVNWHLQRLGRLG